MKLIDADALREHIAALDPVRWGDNPAYNIAIGHSLDAIDAAPTVSCEECKWWRPYSVQESFPPRCGTCSRGVTDLGDTSAPFGCVYFERRQNE